MFIILRNSTKFEGQKVALVDRSRFPDQWWTEEADRVQVFPDRESADLRCSKIKYGSPKVYTYTKGIERLNKAIIHKNWLTRELEEKSGMMDKFDGSWDHGSNTTI